MTRAEKVAEAQRLRAEGLKFREIAERMGCAIQTANGYLNDPDGSRLRARKDSYRGSCVDCGAPTDGSNGRDRAPMRCHDCDKPLVGPRARARFEAQRALIESLWAEGKSCREIGELLGWTGWYLKSGITILRSRGYNVPVRNAGSSAFASSNAGLERLARARAA